jgi:hypothetical protein
MAASDHRSPASSANDGASGTVGSIRSSSANASTRLLDLVHLGHVANFRATVPLTAQPLALSASKAWRFSLPLSRAWSGDGLACAMREKERSAERVRANAPIEPPAARSRGGTIPRDAIVDRAARGARHARALGSQ